MREVTIAAIQMSCSRDVKENIEKAAKLIRAAAGGRSTDNTSFGAI